MTDLDHAINMQVGMTIDSTGARVSQTRMVIECMKSKIAAAILVKLSEITRVKYLSFDKIKLTQADFRDNELPGIQLIDVSETVVHEQSRTKNTWQIALELVMKSTENEPIGQPDLWNLEYEIKRKLWKDPTLGIKKQGFIQLNLLGSATDLHLLQPFYFCRIDFEALYYEHIVREC